MGNNGAKLQPQIIQLVNKSRTDLVMVRLCSFIFISCHSLLCIHGFSSELYMMQLYLLFVHFVLLDSFFFSFSLSCLLQFSFVLLYRLSLFSLFGFELLFFVFCFLCCTAVWLLCTDLFVILLVSLYPPAPLFFFSFFSSLLLVCSGVLLLEHFVCRKSTTSQFWATVDVFICFVHSVLTLSLPGNSY